MRDRSKEGQVQGGTGPRRDRFKEGQVKPKVLKDFCLRPLLLFIGIWNVKYLVQWLYIALFGQKIYLKYL
jgi:hypothetical protein